jgi:hypothetical protein
MCGHWIMIVLSRVVCEGCEVWTFCLYKNVQLGLIVTERVWCMSLLSFNMILWYYFCFFVKKKTLGCPSLTINISLLQFLFQLTLQLFYFKCQFVLRSKLLGIWEWILLLYNFMRPYIIWKLCLSIIPSLQFWIFDSSTY